MLVARKTHKNYRGLGHILPLMKELNTNVSSQYCPEDFIWFLLLRLLAWEVMRVKLRDSLPDKPLSLCINAYCVHVWAPGCRREQKDIEGQLEQAIPTNCVNLTEGSCQFYPKLFWSQAGMLQLASTCRDLTSNQLPLPNIQSRTWEIDSLQTLNGC